MLRLLCQSSAGSQTLVRWARRSQRGGGLLLHRALTCTSSRRCHGTGSGEVNGQPAENGSGNALYRDSVLLPKTEFPMKLTGQKLLDRELQIQQVQQANEISFKNGQILFFLCCLLTGSDKVQHTNSLCFCLAFSL